MPPRGHSSSSHSSSSHSSGSSRSYSSSRSSGSSSRSSSSHSSSSRSSYSRSPSPHSSTSRSSRQTSYGNASYSRQQSSSPSPPPKRPRINQPAGFRPVGGRRPSYYYGRRHDYIYYPIAWTDSVTGTTYEKGYYDENGKRYENVSFEKNGRYENVICHCPYCGQDTILNLNADQISSQSLQCPHCSGPMEVRSMLDEAVRSTGGSAVYGTTGVKKKKKHIGLIVAISLLVFILIGMFSNASHPLQEPSVQNNSSQQVYMIEDNTNTDLFGEVISLVSTGNNAYRIISDNQSAEKKITWDSYQESYYDIDSDCWLWYNTDLEPPIWQYWYEGISSDYGDYGWMEHDDDGWFIEAGSGNWIPLPSKYDTDQLWYIAD